LRILWIDPGLKTGICHLDTEHFEDVHFAIIPNGLKGLQKWYAEEANYFAGMHLDVIGCESFELEEGTHGIDYEHPLAIIHWLEEGGMSHNYFKPIVWQRRMQRGKNTVARVDVLKRAGLYPKRGELKEGHQVAALQHLLAYLMRIGNRETIELLHPKDLDV
jgi:hypothetical protein